MAPRGLLLDTQVLMWMDYNRELIPQAIWAAMESAPSRLYSAASAWETAIKRASGKLQLQEPLSTAAKRFQLKELAMTVVHGEIAGSLPKYHKDPFDRMLVAQAQIEGLVLVTVDKVLQKYDVEILLV